MQVPGFFFAICFILGMGSVTSLTSLVEDYGFCPPNERFVRCINLCNTCDSDGDPCIQICIRGCDCIPGYTRDEFGDCIPRRLCNETNELQVPRTCPDRKKCIDKCVREKWKTGKCVGRKNGVCKCTNETQSGEIETRDQAEYCPDLGKCIRNCKYLGFRTGECRGGRCYCIRHQNIQGDPANTFICPFTNSCIASCRRQGYQSGYCRGLDCICFNPNIPPPPSCVTCNSDCIARGYRFGLCTAQACSCYF